MATVRELYEKGKVYYDREDWSNAAYYLKQSANMGHETSAYFLSKLYADGKGVAQDWTLALLYVLLSERNGSSSKALKNQYLDRLDSPRRTYYSIDVNQMRDRKETMLRRLRNHDVSALKEMQTVNRNLHYVWPYVAYEMAAMGMFIYYMYSKTGNPGWFDEAINEVEQDYQNCIDEMLDQMEGL